MKAMTAPGLTAYNRAMNMGTLIISLRLALFSSHVSAYTQRTDDAVWREFMTWAATVPAATFVGEGN